MTEERAASEERRVPAWSVEGVSVVYGEVVALRDVTLRIDGGEAVALVGPSGAGKTTLLRLLAGQLTPSEGTVRVNGRPLSEVRDRRELTALVGMVQQRLDLVPQLSARHNIQAGLLGRWGLLRSLAALVLPVEAPAARLAARRLGIEDKLRTRVGRLSGGEQQRVALARLLVQDPQTVLADEPVASLDPARADDLLQLMRDLACEGGRTLVASLHSPELARRHFDRVIGLREGRVSFDLPADAVSPDALDAVYELVHDGHGEVAPSPAPHGSADTAAARLQAW